MKDCLKNLYDVTFKLFEFDDFIIVSVPKVGTTFLSSFQQQKKFKYFSATFQSLTKCTLEHKTEFYNTKSLEDVIFPDSDFFRFPIKFDTNTNQPRECKKIYFLYRDPTNRLISGLSQDYFKPWLDVKHYGHITDGKFVPNQFLEVHLNTHELYPQSLHQTNKQYIADYLINNRDSEQILFKSFSELDDYLISFIVYDTFIKLNKTKKSVYSGHNTPYLHILFLLKLNYNHLNFIDIDEENILDILKKNHNFNIDESTLTKYENDTKLKSMILTLKRSHPELFHDIENEILPQKYYYNFLKSGEWDTLFTLDALSKKLTNKMEL